MLRPPTPLESSHLMLMGAGRSGGGGFVGPLDDYEAGLTLAWDIKRRLLASYTGPAFLARADRTGQPTQAIGFKGDGTWDTAALLSFADGDDVYLVTPYNQCGSGIVATNALAATQPRIVTAGVIETDGAVFDGTTTTLNVTLADILDLIGAGQGQFYSRLLSASAGSSIGRLFLDNTSQLLAYLPFHALGNVYFDWTFADRIQAATPGSFVNVLSDVSCEKYAATSAIRINGSSVASGAATGTYTSAAATFNIGLGFEGNISSFVVWNTCDASTAAARYAALTA